MKHNVVISQTDRDFENSLSILEQQIGYRFQDRYLLICALTHSSYANEQKIRLYEDYERLEFLGDAVLEMLSSTFLYRHYPEKREGELTKMRASLVCEPALAHCARQFGLDRYIRLGKGEEAGGGRSKDSIVSDVCEALLGAIYLDSGDIGKARAFVMRFILSDPDGKLMFYDAKSILQERVQKSGGAVTYEIVDESGPEHMKIYTAACLIDGSEYMRGSGGSKKAAEQEAAYRTLLDLENKKGSDGETV